MCCSGRSGDSDKCNVLSVFLLLCISLFLRNQFFFFLQVLASLLYRWLMDMDRVCSVCDAKLSSESQRSTAMFAEVVWHVLVNLGRTEG